MSAGVIVELEGGARPGASRTSPFPHLLVAAACSLVVAFFVSVPYWPKEWTVKQTRVTTIAPAPRGPSVLASLRPAVLVPSLALPDGIATVVQRISPAGETGLISSTAAITTFRLRASGDLVAVSAPLGLDPVVRPQGDSGGHRIRGAYAAATTEGGFTVLRWSENGITYQVSSRSLDAMRLAEVANKLE